ncbi:hypothetical protein FHX08_005860 [Rhizobium sp. BK529]|uniref:hypothetical protein n=1 Tax=unclassified Rhizobium TaxID=2613769 RepID=UPI00104FB753|nr:MULTISPECIES: hypothetical protein [unclassified Rhizobium]MBB3595448.1 hypothetical protein [Rhizobium sp. BK529]TCS00760.1 hypothetical protein EV281_107194 [Rhizobium sp. BK418]
MNSVSFVGTVNSGVHQLTGPERPESVLDYLQSDYLDIDPPDVHLAMLKLFSDDPKSQSAFAREYSAVMAIPQNTGISPENGQFLALEQMIVDNRDAFPAEGFTITTKLPGGGSIVAEVPPSNSGGKDKGSHFFIFSSGDSAALSRIVSALMLSHQDVAGADRLDATQDQLAGLYA